MKKYLLSVCTVVVALGAMLLTSCSDADQAKEMGLTKVLSPTNLKAVSNQMEPSITVSWDAMSNAESYILEAYVEDPTYSGTPAIQVETAATSYVLTDLLGETEYNIRVKGIAEGLEESRWSEITRATAAEQILSIPYTKIEETSITLTWPVNKTIDRLDVIQNGNVIKSITSGLDNGTYTVTGLTGGTNYTFEVYLTGKRRGYIDQVTEIGEPTDVDYIIDGSTISDENSMQKVLNTVAEQATAAGKTDYSVTVTIPAGKTVGLYNVDEGGTKSNLTIPDGMSVYFYGDKDNMPTLDMTGVTQMNINGNHRIIAFQKVKLIGNKYFMNQSAACNVTNLSFELCEIKGFSGNTFIRTQGSNKPTIASISIKKCIISECSSKYSILDLRKGVITSVVIENSTIYNSAMDGKNLVQYDSNTTLLRVANTTLYNICGNANYLIAFGGTSVGADSFIFENVLMAGGVDDSNKAIQAASNPTVSNTYCTSDWYKTFDGVEMIDVEASAVFADPENGDFTVKPAYQELGAGDPRWLGE